MYGPLGGGVALSFLRLPERAERAESPSSSFFSRKPMVVVFLDCVSKGEG